MTGLALPRRAAPTPRLTHPRPGHRLRARLRATALDRQLAAGVAPQRTPLHAARAAQILDARRRSRLAQTLERMVRDARAVRVAREWPGGGTTPDRGAVLGCAAQITDLAELLRSTEPVSAAGVAGLSMLLVDGTGPLYTSSRIGELQRTLHRISRSLTTPV